MRVGAILNPRAGVSAERARHALGAAKGPFAGLDLRTTAGPGDATRLARELVSDGCTTVLVAGGDGTLNEAAQGLLGTGATLGVIPMGSGNGLARSLGIPREPHAALRALGDAVTRRMDVGYANDRPFLNVAGVGFDAVIGRAFQEKGGRRGFLSYLQLSLAHALRYVPDELELDVGQGGIPSRPLVIVAANGRQYGAGAILAPRAMLDDGRLSLVTFEYAPLHEIFWNVPRLFLGTLSRSRRFRCFETERGVISGASPFAHHSDGEPEAPTGRLEFRIEPRILPVLVPRATALDSQGPFALEGA